MCRIEQKKIISTSSFKKVGFIICHAQTRAKNCVCSARHTYCNKPHSGSAYSSAENKRYFSSLLCANPNVPVAPVRPELSRDIVLIRAERQLD